jgi:signal transduction histidine kinase/CheY-like chemotaxis protein
MAALIYVQVGLRHERVERVTDSAMHQSQVLAAEVETLTDGARQMMLAVSTGRATQALLPSCADQLAPLHDALGSYALLEVVTADHRIVCAVGAPAPPALPAQIDAAMAAGHFVVGRYTPSAAGPAILPLIQPFTTATGQRAAIVSAIDLDWLLAHMQRFRASSLNSISIADAAGTLLVRLPGGRGFVGHPVADDARDLVGAASPGTRPITGLDGKRRVVGYVPASVTGGLYVAYGVYVPDILASIDRTAQRGYILIAIGAILALLLMLVITRRLVHAPTEALLSAAQRWAAGDLAARAVVQARSGTEFARLASAFNTMAEALDARRAQLQQLNASLEARVQDRTQALSETNNRLQVEINERERTDAALRQSQKLQAVGHLAGGMAHEFNNLLATIMGGLDLLRARLGPDHALHRYVTPALDAAHRGARLTSQLLAFARRRRLLPVAVDLNAVIAEMRELIEGTLGRGIALSVTPAEGLWPALADRHEIEAAILNLILNARDAMPNGGTLRLSTRNASTDGPDGPSDLVELTVQDNGAGMNADQLARAVDPFYTTKGHGQGAGLGLSQVHGIAEELGGDLRIRSIEGAGTTVSLLLPRAAAVPLPAASGAAVALSRSLLLVDDDAQVRSICAEMLGELGYDVRTAASGEEALALITAQPFAVLLADYAMPGMSGIDLITRAGRLRPGMVALLITGYMDFDGTVGAALLAPRQVLRKPFTLHDLSQRIAELSGRLAEPV